MEKTNSQKMWEFISRWLTFATVLTAIITFGLRDHSLLQQHESIIQAYESHGTPQAVRLQTATDERFKSVERRIELLEQVVLTIPDIRVNMEKLNGKMDLIKDEIERHVRGTP